MAKNPMQRKAQNSFLLGMLLTVLITGIIIALLFVQLNKVNNELKILQANKTSVCVLKSEVRSGQTITQDLVTTKVVDSTTIPANAVGEVSSLQTYALETANGLEVTTNENGDMVVPDINSQTGEQQVDQLTGELKYRVIISNGDSYYYQDTGEKVEVMTIPMIAKVDMQPNTVLTDTLVAKSSERITDDVRQVEYNMFTLSSQLQNEQYVDVRLRLPDGSDYIVATHKRVTIPVIEDVDSVSTVILNVREDEILQLNCAIVEAYQIPGSNIYVTLYAEPGLQDAAVPTYVPSTTILGLIQRDPNCVQTAKQELFNRLYENGAMKNDATQQRQPINNALNGLDPEEAQESIIDKVEEEITKTREERQRYLESLGY